MHNTHHQSVFTPRIGGFTMTELLVVVAIISVLTAASIFGVINVGRRATYQKVYNDLNDLTDAIELARLNTGKRLSQITGSACSECACRNVDTRTNTACWNRYVLSINNINTAAGETVIVGYPRDPWGSPYLINENEGENYAAPLCPDTNGDGFRCCYDNLASAGPNHSTPGGYESDDVVRNSPPLCKPIEGVHHVDQPPTDIAP